MDFGIMEPAISNNLDNTISAKTLLDQQLKKRTSLIKVLVEFSQNLTSDNEIDEVLLRKFLNLLIHYLKSSTHEVLKEEHESNKNVKTINEQLRIIQQTSKEALAFCANFNTETLSTKQKKVLCGAFGDLSLRLEDRFQAEDNLIQITHRNEVEGCKEDLEKTGKESHVLDK